MYTYVYAAGSWEKGSREALCFYIATTSWVRGETQHEERPAFILLLHRVWQAVLFLFFLTACPAGKEGRESLFVGWVERLAKSAHNFWHSDFVCGREAVYEYNNIWKLRTYGPWWWEREVCVCVPRGMVALGTEGTAFMWPCVVCWGSTWAWTYIFVHSEFQAVQDKTLQDTLYRFVYAFV